jgi:hypothetical protein
MNIPAPDRIRPLRGIGPGKWRTRDEEFDIVENPGAHPDLGIGSARSPRHVWFIYPMKTRHKGVDDSLPVFVKGQRAWRSLRDAVAALEEARRTDSGVDAEPSE